LQNQYVKDSMSCNSSASSCKAQEYSERYHYTGKMRENWEPMDWDSGATTEVPVPMPKRISEKSPGLDLSFKVGIQRGELQHEARVDRVYREVRIENGIMQTNRSPGNVVQGNEYRWVSDPKGPIGINRIGFGSCVNGVCSSWR